MSQNLKRVGPYRFIKLLGKGSFAEVYEAKKEGSEDKYAVKMISLSAKTKGVSRELIAKEIQLIKALSHENVVTLFDALETTNNYYIIFELCQRGDLDYYLKTCGEEVPIQTVQHIVFKVASCIQFLHQRGIVHRDLKMANILLKKDFTIKLADFGLAKDTNELEDVFLKTYCGTPLTMAPEIFKRQAYDSKCDIWSLGIIVFQLVYRRKPFAFTDLIQYVEVITQTMVQIPSEPAMPESFVALVRGSIEKDSAKRLSIEQFLNNPWVQEGAKYSWRTIPLAPPPIETIVKASSQKDFDMSFSEESQAFAYKIRELIQMEVNQISVNFIAECQSLELLVAEMSSVEAQLIFKTAWGQFMYWMKQSDVELFLENKERRVKLKDISHVKFNYKKQANIEAGISGEFKGITEKCLSFLDSINNATMTLLQRTRIYSFVKKVLALIRRFKLRITIPPDSQVALSIDEVTRLLQSLQQSPPQSTSQSAECRLVIECIEINKQMNNLVLLLMDACTKQIENINASP